MQLENEVSEPPKYMVINDQTINQKILDDNIELSKPNITLVPFEASVTFMKSYMAYSSQIFNCAMLKN